MNIINKIIKNKFFEPSARILLYYLITIYLSGNIGVFIFTIITTPILLIKNFDTSGDNFETGLILFTDISCIITAYFVMKICGIFKIIKDRNIFKEILKYCLFVFIIITLMYIKFFIFNQDIKNSNNESGYFIICFDAVFVYPMYKIFEFLTKKFKFFQKFGYFVSYRFYRDMFLRLKNKLSKK